MTAPDTPLRPPCRLALLGEARIVVEWTALQLSLRGLRATAPQGDGSPVMVIPGFATDDSWTERLRGFLADIGWQVRGWGLGRNHGRVAELIPKVVERAVGFADDAGTPLRLVGWSLGGYLAREAAREHPEVVDRVVTLGAPIIGGPKYTASAPMYLRKGYDLDAIETDVEARERDPIRVPVDAVYSRSDGVVAWRACIDRHTPRVRHHPVGSSHLGLVSSAPVFRLVAELLAESSREP
ncbi:MAG: alpha/beta hydrolase [Holophagae bacterium]|jgi:pimeloyl-ACP methyl ester carboxylesterase